LLRTRSDVLQARNAARAKLRSIANQATQRGNHGKAARIHKHNLGTAKKHRQEARWKRQVRDVTYQAVHAVADKATVIVAEDLTRPFTRRKKLLGRNTNRRLAAWTRGVTAQALQDVSDRRGSVVRLVNAAYTSQVIPGTYIFGVRSGDRLHCTLCGVVWDVDHAAAINVLDRNADPDIGLHTPHTRVKQIIQERGRHRSRLPDQDSSTAGDCRCGERMIQTNGQQ
jgi:IS605 OrfB family transposase